LNQEGLPGHGKSAKNDAAQIVSSQI